MKFKTELVNGFAVVTLEGEIDLSCAPAVRKAILEHVLAGESTLVDLAAVTYIDSSGIASLVEGHQAAKRKGHAFGLLNVSEPVMNVLALARLDRVFSLHRAVPAQIQI
jgi:anti-sigma B factor antagonist